MRHTAHRAGRALTGGLAGALLLSGCATASPQVERAANPLCPRQQTVVRRALAAAQLHVDVTGDGRPDTVAAATDPGASPPCRAFVAVRVAGGPVLSRHLIPAAIPIAGIQARVLGLPQLRGHPGAEIVVDTGAAADAILAQMFTVVDGRLRPVHVPDQADGTFLVAGGGVMFPRAAGCTTDGRLVLSRAAQQRNGTAFRVLRRTYALSADRLGFSLRTAKRATVATRRLGVRFPEFGGRHWQPCSGTGA